MYMYIVLIETICEHYNVKFTQDFFFEKKTHFFMQYMSYCLYPFTVWKPF